MFFISKKYDLSGNKYGKLTVIEKTDNPNNKKKRTFWRCECDCGNESIVDTSRLLSGKATQCWDCAHMKTGSAKRKDLTGQRFGKLIVTDMIYGSKDKNGKQRTYCDCKCDCGKSVIRLVDGLYSDVLCSCGCARKEISDKLSINIIGETFGYLTVLEEYKDETPRKVKCICKCGNVGIYIKTDVLSQYTQSCGCLRIERTSSSNTKDWTNFINDYDIEIISPYEKNKHGTWLWNCRCSCGKEFVTLPADVVSNKITSCGCAKMSSGERYVEKVLKEESISYKSQFYFDDCKDINPLPFDFAVFCEDKIKLIEFDGLQHFESIEWFGGDKEFVKRKYHDQIKNEYCKNNNVPLLRIKYSLKENQIKDEIIKFIAP